MNRAKVVLRKHVSVHLNKNVCGGQNGASCLNVMQRVVEAILSELEFVIQVSNAIAFFF